MVDVIDLAKVETRFKIVTVYGGKKNVTEKFELLNEEGEKHVFRTKLGGTALVNELADIAPDDFTVENENIEQRFWNLYGKKSEK